MRILNFEEINHETYEKILHYSTLLKSILRLIKVDATETNQDMLIDAVFSNLSRIPAGHPKMNKETKSIFLQISKG